MNAATEQIIANRLSQRLKQETAAEHERMHNLMAQADVFSSKENMGNSRFLNIISSKKASIWLKKKGWLD